MESKLPSTTATEPNTLRHQLLRYSSSPWPAYTLSALFAASAFIPPARIAAVPIVQRLGFSITQAGAGYVISTGDTRNGSGIATAWTLTYLFWNGRRSFKPPLNPATLLLTFATMAGAGLYGTEYFVYQD